MLRHVRLAPWLLGLGLLSCMAGQALAEGTTLRWQFKPGETLRYVMTQDMTQDLQVRDKPIKVSTKMVMDLLWTVKSVDAQGVADVNQIIDRIQMKIGVAQGAKVEYDSASDKEPEGLVKSVAPLFQSMVKKPIVTKINRQGRVIEMKLPQEMIDQLAKAPSTKDFAKMFSAEGMKQLTGISALPTSAIEPGKTWSEEATIDNPVLGKQKVKSTYTYAGPKTIDGHALEQIDSVVQMEITPGEATKNTITLKGQESRGTTYFDNVAGRVWQTSMKMTMTMDVAAGAEKMTNVMSTTTELKLVPRP